ncbi:MmcB family DNA repair protein [Acinetobacter sp. ANC 3813]|uniref:MmcB family DNA repair protein n=1 Tax=Acinetobacter sp. ANC 3813 TaxID=1977873 RepID=UPI000A348A33|nr:MmcB family DNA repair protein [Acinetobacter sp. ANC 3813]OTG87909.1 hypothetical protein B9T34_16380 [Acinetobacter sp. ANC 3813]
MNNEKKWGHDELAKDLAAHLAANNDRMIWLDMQLGPAGSPRPDVFTAPKSYSGFKPIAYECKVSVSDYRSDITSGKWMSYLKYASGVVFAVPKGLIQVKDLPEGCGLIVRSENCWRMVKGPTLRPIANDLPKDFWIKLLIDGVTRTVRDNRYKQSFEHITQKKITEKYGAELGEALRRRDNAVSSLEYKTQQLKKQIGDVNFLESAERQRNSLETDKKYLEKANADLCELLGLPAGSHVWTIRDALDKQKKMLTESSQIQAVQKSLNSAVKSLHKQLEELEELRFLAGVGDVKP